MIDMHSKYDIKYENEMFYALIWINNHIITCINFMLSYIWYQTLSLHMLFHRGLEDIVKFLRDRVFLLVKELISISKKVCPKSSPRNKVTWL